MKRRGKEKYRGLHKIKKKMIKEAKKYEAPKVSKTVFFLSWTCN